METLELENFSELSQTDIQEMNGGMYMLTNKADYQAQLAANQMIIDFCVGLWDGLLS